MVHVREASKEEELRAKPSMWPAVGDKPTVAVTCKGVIILSMRSRAYRAAQQLLGGSTLYMLIPPHTPLLKSGEIFLFCFLSSE